MVGLKVMHITSQLKDGHPTARRDLDGPDDNDFVRLNTSSPNTPFRGRVLIIKLALIEECIHGSSHMLRQL